MNKEKLHWYEKNQKKLFWGLVVCIWGAVFLFSLLTPMLSDDLLYGLDAKLIHTPADLFRQEYEHYMGHSGRSIVHLFVRLFLIPSPIVFDVVNAFVFTAVILMIYWNVTARKQYDLWVLAMAFFLVWFKAVAFAETVLWQVGATNYLWGFFWILSFVSCYRYGLQKETRGEEQPQKGHNLWKTGGKAVGMYLYGVIAGWCNENTSGGGLLLCMLFLGCYLWERKGRKPALWMLTGLLGQLTGLFFMVLSPGSRMRASFADEEHTGLLKYIGRFQKLTLSVREEFFLLLAIWIVAFFLCRMQKKTLLDLRTSLIYLVAFVATAYALVAAAPAQPRALFGAGMFLIIALLNCLVQISVEKEVLLAALKPGIFVILILYFFMSYIDNGANLFRIYRDEMERQAYIEEQKAQGNFDVIVPQMRPDFMTEYSAAYRMDLEEDPAYWINNAYQLYFGLDSIQGMPREEWEELVHYEEW